MTQPPRQRPFQGQGWPHKFACAFRGLWSGLLDVGRPGHQNSFLVHLPAAVLVIAFALWLQVDRVTLVLLLGCIALVWITELLNTCLERLAEAITQEYHEQIRMALDVASGTVLLSCLFSTAMGTLLLWPYIFG